MPRGSSPTAFGPEPVEALGRSAVAVEVRSAALVEAFPGRIALTADAAAVARRAVVIGSGSSDIGTATISDGPADGRSQSGCGRSTVASGAGAGVDAGVDAGVGTEAAAAVEAGVEAASRAASPADES